MPDLGKMINDNHNHCIVVVCKVNGRQNQLVDVKLVAQLVVRDPLELKVCILFVGKLDI